MSQETQSASVSSKPYLLVTGGAGYIGSHFIQRYIQHRPQQKFLVLDDLREGNPEAIKTLSDLYPDQIVFRQTRIGDPQVAGLLKEYAIDAAVHFSASASVAHSQKDPMSYLKNNVGETLQFLDYLLAANIRNFVFSSTAAVYGTPDTDLILEDEIKNPVNVYGKTKLMVEEMLALLNERDQLSYIALRYFNAAGADPAGLLGEGHHEETHLIPIVLQVATGQRDRIYIYGTDYDTPDGTCVRDYIHIYDLADAHIAALDYLKKYPGTGEAFNLGTGKGDSVKEVIEHCRRITGKEIAVEIAPRREGDPAVLVAGSAKAQRVLEWKPQFGLNQIIETAWQWEQNRRFCIQPKVHPVAGMTV